MAVKLHLFSGFENKKLGIKSDRLLGHLYDDENSMMALARAAADIGADPNWLQFHDGFYHIDLWGEPLEKAKKKYQIVSDEQLFDDMKAIVEEKKQYPSMPLAGEDAIGNPVKRVPLTESPEDRRFRQLRGGPRRH